MTNWRERISFDPNACHGKACVRGTRMMACVVLDNLAAGRTSAQMLAGYPNLGDDTIRAALAYAAESF